MGVPLKLTPAMLADSLHRAIKDSAHKVAEVLLGIGADIEEPGVLFGYNSRFGTPLLSAASQGSGAEMIRLLLDNGANLAARCGASTCSGSVLHYAVRRDISSLEGLKYLLSRLDLPHGLLDCKTIPAGHTPLHWCAYAPGGPIHIEAAMLLIERGANLALENSDGQTPSQYAKYLHGAKCQMSKFLWSKLTPEQQVKQGAGRS